VANEPTKEPDTQTVIRIYQKGRNCLAQMEREFFVERTKAGLDAARKLGRVGDDLHRIAKQE